MIHVRYSNRVEQLVGALAGALPPPGAVDALFDGPWLVIPSRPLELYVDLELARRRGISGNIDTFSVRGAFARLCADAHPDITLIDRGHVVGELLALFTEESLERRPVFAQLHRYLLAAGAASDAVNRRRVDLARALGGLFDEWSLTRPELLATWRAASRRGSGDADTAAPADGHTPTWLASAEQALWNGLFGPEGRFQRRGAAEGRRYLTLDAMFADNLDSAWRPPSALHFFGLSAIPRGLQQALSRLAARTTVEIYAVNPCREFWEDLETRPARGAPLATPAVQRRRRSGSGARTNARQLQFAALVAPAGADSGGPSPTSDTADGAPMAPFDGGGEVNGEATVGDNPFLRAWGHAGRESTRLLNQLSDGDFQSHFAAPVTGADAHTSATSEPADGSTAQATLLARVQQDMLDRQPSRRDQRILKMTPDGSLMVLGAPNPRRELETIAAEIWALVRAGAGLPGVARPDGEPLRFSDVAVLIAGSEEPYLSLARAVFHEAQDLPHSLVDQPLTSGTHLVEAVLALLALPLGTFTRREVLDVVTHPNVRARFPEADPQTWLALCDGLAIAHGVDRAALADTYIDRDLFNWDQGLRRLALGVFARGPRSGADQPVVLPVVGASLPAQTADADNPSGYLPAEVSTDLRADADGLALLVRSLLADARFARSARLTLPDWTSFVRAVMGAYVVAVTPDDELARLRVFTALDQLAAEAPPKLVVTLGTALELVRGALQGLRGTRGQMLGGGVTVGTMAALRALPFRVIFVAGLDADRFPSGDRPSPFEPSQASQGSQPYMERPRAGDVTPRQQDRYLFLETMLAARDSLVLSYVDRDSLTGEVREPSPLVLELLDELKRGYLPDGAADAPKAPSSKGTPASSTPSMVRRVPLHRDEDPRIHAAFPAAAAEARARDVGASLQAGIPAAAGLAPAAILRGLSPDARRSLSPLLRTVAVDSEQGRAAAASARHAPPSFDGTSPGAVRRVVRLIDLRRFLECPLQGSARIFLGLRDLPDETEARETGDEPFDVPRWMERSFLGEVLAAAWATTEEAPQAGALPAAYDAGIARHRHGRVFPAGLFRANVRLRHLRILEQWLDSLASGGATPRGPARRVCFGRPEPFAPPSERRPAIQLTVELDGAAPGGIPVELHGITEPQLATDAGSGSLVLATSYDRENNDKDSLRAFLDHLALAASSPAPGQSEHQSDAQAPRPFVGAVCRPSRDGSLVAPHVLSWQPLAAASARAYLTDLVRELLSGVHGYLFPCEAVFRSFDGQMTLVDRIDQVRADKYYREHSSSKYGPVPEPFDYPTPSAALAERYAASRFGLLRAWYPQPRPRGKRGAS